MDGKLWRTLRALFTRPGQLTVEFMRGRRSLFVAPLQLFLISNVVFFFMNSIAGFNTFTTPFYTHLYQSPYSKFARSIALPRLTARDMPISDYALKFNEAIDVNARTLIIVMVPILSLFVLAAYWRAKRYYVQHLTFSLHFYAFLLLLTSVSHALTTLAMRMSQAAGVRLSDRTVDDTVTMILLGLIIRVHLSRAAAHLW